LSDPTTGAQHCGNHRSRRRLAVATGHRDAVLHAHQLGEHLGARDNRNVSSPRFQNLRLEYLTAVEITTPKDSLPDCLLDGRRTPAPLTSGVAPSLRFRADRAGHGIPQVQQHFCDPAHANAADANEVESVPFMQHRIPITVRTLPAYKGVALIDDSSRGFRSPHGTSRGGHALYPLSI
jgi:hypothetical protein